MNKPIERSKLSLKNKPSQLHGEAEPRRSFPLGDIDFLSEWNYGKLCEYREGLINSIASMNGQLARSEMESDTDPAWVNSTTFLKSKGEMMLAEVTRRINLLETQDAGTFIRAAGEIFESEDVQELIDRAARYGRLPT